MLSATSMTPYNAFKTKNCPSSFATPRTRCPATSPSSSELIHSAELRRTCHDTLILSAPSSRSPTVLPPRSVHLGTNGDVATAALDDVQARLAELNTYIAATVDAPRGNETTRQGDDPQTCARWGNKSPFHGHSSLCHLSKCSTHHIQEV
ncbi:hypothetical protein FKP32DRAFT_538318 [Trametes sanguinea]|nr:hypothetical protein FKP32DRAFT_538318 [Trametes sanguinea]